jgi:hypothetical protein
MKKGKYPYYIKTKGSENSPCWWLYRSTTYNSLLNCVAKIHKKSYDEKKGRKNTVNTTDHFADVNEMVNAILLTLAKWLFYRCLLIVYK